MPIVVNIAITALTKNKILKNFSTLIREFFETFMFVDIMIPIIEESNKTAKVLNKLSLERVLLYSSDNFITAISSPDIAPKAIFFILAKINSILASFKLESDIAICCLKKWSI